MRIVVWNMSRASASTGADAGAWSTLMSLEPDVALLAECTPPPPHLAQGAFYLRRTRSGCGTGIWSRWPLKRRGPLPADLAPQWRTYRRLLGGSVASARVQVPGGGELSVMSVHANPQPVVPTSLRGLPADAMRLPGAQAVWPADVVRWALGEQERGGTETVVGGDWGFPRVGAAAPLVDQSEFIARMASDGWHDVGAKQQIDGRDELPCRVFATPAVYAAVEGVDTLLTDSAPPMCDQPPMVLECGTIRGVNDEARLYLRPDVGEILAHPDGEEFMFKGNRFVRRGERAPMIWSADVFDDPHGFGAPRPIRRRRERALPPVTPESPTPTPIKRSSRRG